MMKDKGGVALMMVLWVLLLLSFIALEFAHSMRTEVEVTKNFRDEIQAYYLARAGIELGRYELAISGRLTPHYRDLESQRLVFGDGEGGECKKPPQCRVFELGNGKCDYRFEAVVSKYPLNKLARNEDALKKFLEKYCGIEAFSEEISMIAYSIKDWVDDDEHYSLPGIGAEDDWYESHVKEYECKDSDFDSIDELSYIRGLRIEDGDSEEEMARKKKIVAAFKRYFGVNPELESSGVTSMKPYCINTADSKNIEVMHEIGLPIVRESPESIQEKKEGDCGKYNQESIGYYYIISTGVMKSSPVQRGIKVSFVKSGDFAYWKPLYWNDNYIPQYYEDPNQNDSGQNDQYIEE